MNGANDEPLIFRHLREDVPNGKQIQFFTAEEQHVCYGGARGGGKSWAMRRKFVMLSMRYAGLKLVLLRRTMPELRRNHIIPLQSELYGYAQYKADERAFVFPNGSRLELGYCDNEGDVLQYQGAEYDVIGFEEATLFPEEWIVMIETSVRTTRPGWRVRFYYTCNPGGIGHAYIKRLFIDRQFKAGEKPEEYRMIRATVRDNHVLMERDPEYISRLEALPPMKRRAMLDGDWTVYEGQVFEEWTDDPDHYEDRTYTHVINPFPPPPQWRIYRSFDFGYAKPFSVGWWAVDYDGRIYRILELYGCVNGEPNTGIRWTPDQIFAEVSKTEQSHPWLKGKQIFGVADPSIWDASRGVSVEEVSEKYRVYWEPGDNNRLPGWMQVHYRLTFDDNGVPMMYIFSNCKDTIRTLPLLQYDKNRVEDVDTDGEDHIADEVRYLCMMCPMKPVKTETRKPKVYDPLDINTGTKVDDYEFFRRLG
jgi:phage terminase large subunit